MNHTTSMQIFFILFSLVPTAAVGLEAWGSLGVLLLLSPVTTPFGLHFSVSDLGWSLNLTKLSLESVNPLTDSWVYGSD